MTQALVAIGGGATRLTGVEVPISKAFLPGCGGRPFLYWCLRSLEQAGIRRVVLAAHEPAQEHAAWQVIGERHWAFEKVDTFRDAGLGVHGIPHQAQGLLRGDVLFEAGHGVCSPEHYRLLAARKSSTNVVFSAFVPRADNPRFEAGVRESGRCTDAAGGSSWALAHPMVIDPAYAAGLPEHGFDVHRVAATYLRRDALVAVPATSPVEFDIAREYRRAVNVHAVNARECADGMPWRAAPLTTAAETTVENRGTP